tara:strand:- start:366 stop:2075 length:1710 start_codon:yes stop_codon:yes gene_type:complete
MGIPVTGKNFFPSNIQGLPTWYEIRVTKDSYLARSGRVDIMVAMNAETYQKDLEEVSPGGVLIYDSSWPRDDFKHRSDIQVLGVPLARMCNEHFSNARARILMKNISYVGSLAALVEIDLEIIKSLLSETFASKAHLIDSNMEAIKLGYDFAKENFSCPLETRTKKMNKTKAHIMIDGNTAAGLGCVYAGATVGAWYPITPSTSLMDAFKSFSEKFRRNNETGERNYIMIQAEDELAAIGMVLGANWNGARSFTSTSGPGISLMGEFLGLAYYAELPAVVFDVQRVGPSTGMPTRTQQCDILSAAYSSHGDTKHIILFPSNPKECFEMAREAFDLADKFQTPVFVLTDLDIGMNDWMSEELTWDDKYIPNKGKVLNASQLEKMEKFYRYLDSDGDGIPYRTYPGVHPKGAYFVRGSGHNKFGGYTEDSTEYQEVIDRLVKKFTTASNIVPKPETKMCKKKTNSAIISLGSCDYAVLEAMDELSEKGVHLDYLRIKAFPFSKEVINFINNYESLFIVEQNRDAQLKSLLIIETDCPKKKMHSVLSYSGLPISSSYIVSGIEKIIDKGQAA